MRFPNARGAIGDSSRIRSRTLEIMRCGFMLRASSITIGKMFSQWNVARMHSGSLRRCSYVYVLPLNQLTGLAGRFDDPIVPLSRSRDERRQ